MNIQNFITLELLIHILLFFGIELDCCTVHIIGDCWSCSLYVCHNVSMIDYWPQFDILVLAFVSIYMTIKWRILKTLNNKLKLEMVKNLD